MTVASISNWIDLDVPPDFYEVPLEPSIEDRVFGQQRILDKLALDDRAQREGLGWYLEALSRSVNDGAVVSTAFCAVRLGGRPSSATLTVAMYPAESDDPLVFALGATRSMRSSGLYASVDQENLGRTLAAVAYGHTTSTARHVTIALPVPGQHLSVLLSLTTTDGTNFATYEKVVRQTAASVRVVRGPVSGLF